MRLLHQVAVAPVDDGQHQRPPGPYQIHRAVGVGGGARLAYGDDQRVAQVVTQALVLGAEPRQLAGGHGIHEHPGSADGVADGRRRAAGRHRRRALADDDDAAEGTVRQPRPQVGGQGLLAQPHREPPSRVDYPSPQGLAERAR